MEQQLYELPEGWEWSSIAEQTLTTKNIKPSASPEQQFTYIDISSIDRNRKEIVDPKLIVGADAPSRAKKEVIGNDVLFATTRPNLKNIAIFSGDIESPVASTGFCVLRASESIDYRYLFRYLTTDFLQDQIAPYIAGAQYPAVTDKNLKRTPIPLPPLDEQKRIVANLDALFTRIDAAITHLQETLELTKALFASEANIIFDQISNKYGTTSLSKVVQINSGIALPKIFKDWKGSGSIPFYKVAQMNNDDRVMKDAAITFNSEVALTHKIKIFPKGSVLIPKRGGAILTDKKRLLLEDASYDSNVMGLKADEKIIKDEYLFRYLLSINLGDYIDTSTIPQINNKHIDRMEIPLAPIEEQNRIVSHLDALSERTRDLEAATKEKLNDLTALKASLLDVAFKGQL